MTIAPTLETERLILRQPKAADFESYAAFFASDRAKFEGGPLTRRQAWELFAADAGGWVLRGYGTWALEDKITSNYLGEVGIYQPDYYPEAELGWQLMEEAEGKGIAFEAATTIRDFIFKEFGWTQIVSYIDPRNTRSINLAEHLGGVLDSKLTGPDPEDLVYRHLASEVQL